jgi:hypothetical protein
MEPRVYKGYEINVSTQEVFNNGESLFDVVIIKIETKDIVFQYTCRRTPYVMFEEARKKINNVLAHN